MRLFDLIKIPALALPLFAAGCGTDLLNIFDAGTSGDGSSGDMAAAGDMATAGDMAVTLFSLEPGTYKITAIRNSVDGCQIDTDPMDPITGSTLDLTNDGAGNIELVGMGKGTISFNMGTLTRTDQYDSGSGCTWDFTRTLVVTVTDDNKFTADFTENNSNRLMSCLPNLGPTCKTTWIMDLSKVDPT